MSETLLKIKSPVGVTVVNRQKIIPKRDALKNVTMITKTYETKARQNCYTNYNVSRFLCATDPTGKTDLKDQEGVLLQKKIQ